MATEHQNPVTFPRIFTDNGWNNDSSMVILVIGSIGMDRLLTVQKYPKADAKVRTTFYHECGGGNAANTAAAIGKLCSAKILLQTCESTSQPKLSVRYLGKVGRDVIGETLILEMQESNVDITTPLFRLGPVGSTTSFTTIVVSEEEHTRTCFHTLGTAGELTLDDVNQILGSPEVEKVFENVVHLHSDTRNTEASLAMAKAAKQRGITVSIDCEKDRNSEALDELLVVCDVLFTESSGLEAHIRRLTKEAEIQFGRSPLLTPTIRTEGLTQNLSTATIDTIVRSLRPSSYFARWHASFRREVIVTQGCKGVLGFRPTGTPSQTATDPSTSHPFNNVVLKPGKNDNNVKSPFVLHHSFCDGFISIDVEYQVFLVGTLQNVNIVDTTGAGDAFVAGFLVSRIAVTGTEDDDDSFLFDLQFGTFVGGKKIEGPGARTAQPFGRDIDTILGHDLQTIKESLGKQVGLFDSYK